MEQNSLSGPFILSDLVIDEEVVRKSPGAYVLDDSDDAGGFHVVYTGRSDVDVNNQLHVHVGAYKRFKYVYCSSDQGAFERECGLYHDFEPRDTMIHPRRPAGSGWKCPRCRLFD
jgi:hypothetical protein